MTTKTLQEKIKVVIYGDSIMRATVLDDTNRYRATISGILDRLDEAYQIDFKNRAHFGITCTRGADLLERDLQKGLECDYAVVEFGGNDCSFLWEEVAEDPDYDHQPNTAVQTFGETLTAMVEKLQAAGVPPILMTLPPVDAERHLHFIGRDDTGRRNILQWLGDAHMIYRFHELYSRTIEKVARRTGTILVDVRGRFLDKHNLKELLGEDGIHLSEAGYKIIGETFADFIEAHRTQPPRLVYE